MITGLVARGRKAVIQGNLAVMLGLSAFAAVGGGESPEVSYGLVEPAEIRPGQDIKVSYTLTLTADSTPEHRGAWATALMYEGEYDRAPSQKAVARSSSPMNCTFFSKPAGTKIEVKLTIKGKDTAALKPGAYNIHAYGWGPGEFRAKLGDVKISGEPVAPSAPAAPAEKKGNPQSSTKVGSLEVSDVAIVPQKAKQGQDILLNFTLKLPKELPYDKPGDSWVTALVYPVEKEAELASGAKPFYAARSALPMRLMLKGEKAGPLPMDLKILDDQTAELEPGAYAIYAYGKAPGEFRLRLGEVQIEKAK